MVQHADSKVKGADPKVIREQAVRDAKSNLILDAARKVFSEKGFHETRLEDIASSAGFSKASLYNYYVDKEEIFLSLAIRDFDELLRVLNAQVSPERAFVDTLQGLLTTVLSFFGEHFAFFLTVVSYRSACSTGTGKLSDRHCELLSRFHHEFSEIMGAFTAALRLARERKEIAGPLDESTASGFIVSLLRGVVLDWKMRGGMGDLDAAVRQIVEFVVGGVGCRAAASKQTPAGGRTC